MIYLTDKLRNCVDNLLFKVDLTGRSKTVKLCAAGGNNRIYKVEAESGTYAAKFYFMSEDDPRDRLGAEFAFLSYSQSVVPRVTPRPYAFDRSNGMALYEFVDGRPFSPGEIRRSHIEGAIDFFRNLNDPIQRRKALSLPISSEGCFSVNGHIDIVGDRIFRLLEIPINTAVDRDAHLFLERLADYWRVFTAELPKRVDDLGLDYDTPLIAEQRCVSPCDFGFHNALAGIASKTYFIDFEYAGWDDPSRMAADFFSQVAVPVPAEYFGWFVNEVMAVFPEGDELIQRAYLLWPVYRIKWCCIALNIFQTVHLKRRMFANPDLNETLLKRQQLSKAERIFENLLRGDTYGLH